MGCQDGHRHGSREIRCALRHRILVAAICFQLCGFACAQESGSGPQKLSTAESLAQSVEASFRNDAALADVFFIDSVNGWAVGDRGVIWHTVDGGATWREQSSGTSCRLNSVFFLDARRGWAAGGEHRPYGRSTRGVLLETIDGGVTWHAAQNATLPLLTRIKFFDPNVGVAAGAGSAAHPSGVFATHDGGRVWQPLPADRAGHWLAGDFLDAEAGAVAASAGEFATIAQQRVKHSPLAMPSLRGTHAMRLVGPASGWLVGDGGLLMTTADLGHSWQSALGELPHDIAADFNFHALAVHGENVWIAGAPGTKVLHSTDGGKSWQANATGHFAPIRALAFIDAQHGWAAGDLGTILATRDGGQTWQRQRAGGARAAMLAIFSTAGDVPLELVAEQGAAEGYIAAANILHAENTDNSLSYAAANGRAREAMILAGAASAETAWRFPLPRSDLGLTPADVLAALNRANDGRAIEQLERHLVQTLRMWRPDVVVTRHARPGEHDSLAAAIEHLVVRAAQAAGDPTQFVDLATNAGLEPWKIKTVYGVSPAGVRGQESVVTSSYSPVLGASLADWTAPARRLLLASHVSPPDAHELILLFGEPAAADGSGGIFRGIALARGSEARRALPELPPDNLEELRRIATRRRHLQELLERTEGNVAWAGQVARLVDDLGERGGGELLYQLAAGYRAAGRLDLAADSFYLLAQRYPQHPLVDESLVWLVQFYASSEAARRAALPTIARTYVPDEAEVEQPEAHPAALDAVAPAEAGQTEVHPTAFEEPAIGLSLDDRLRRAAQLAEYLKSARPALYADPAVRFAEVAAQRQLGYANPAKRYFLSLGDRPANDPWRRCAETEQWLAQPNDQPPPKVIAACRRTFERPHLDGQLNEPFWKAADRMLLRGDEEVGRTTLSADQTDATDTIVRPTDSGELRLAYDDAFLYLAVQCPKAIGVDYRPDDSARPRDGDLAQHDRVALRLDLDRDFTTAFQLTVDHRGWTHESCWDDAAWNPSWYVAAASDDERWTVEAAVPLAALTAKLPSPKHVWAVSARRTVPRVGSALWSGGTAGRDSPEQFGLLIFE
jgi:photosystem II stability/assembly factor-like uncharacterized protein